MAQFGGTAMVLMGVHHGVKGFGEKFIKFWVDTMQGTTRQLAVPETTHSLRQFLS
jgi:hypothetical protein